MFWGYSPDPSEVLPVAGEHGREEVSSCLIGRQSPFREDGLGNLRFLSTPCSPDADLRPRPSKRRSGYCGPWLYNFFHRCIIFLTTTHSQSTIGSQWLSLANLCNTALSSNLPGCEPRCTSALPKLSPLTHHVEVSSFFKICYRTTHYGSVMTTCQHAYSLQALSGCKPSSMVPRRGNVDIMTTEGRNAENRAVQTEVTYLYLRFFQKIVHRCAGD